TVDQNTGRVPFHNVPSELIERQAQSVGIPLWIVPLPAPCSNAEYLGRLAPIFVRAVAAGARHIVFGDLFLNDIRQFRESSLAGTGLAPVFPLWNLPTVALAKEMLDGGLRAIITCVDLKRLDADFAAGAFGLRALPPNVDACGENGEFHTFVTDGPMFRQPVEVRLGATRQDGNYAYAPLY
ncbi:MAG: ATP-binding protein, partial [Acidobacteriota bacterium]|nr:ATP-binding protein [Acidobacteriota bacterium]